MNGRLGVLVPGVIGAVFVAIGIPLAQRRVPRSAWYGFRTRTTLKDDDIWYPINERRGRRFVVLGGSLRLVAPIGLIFTGDDDIRRDLLALALAVTGRSPRIWVSSAH